MTNYRKHIPINDLFHYSVIRLEQYIFTHVQVHEHTLYLATEVSVESGLEVEDHLQHSACTAG